MKEHLFHDAMNDIMRSANRIARYTDEVSEEWRDEFESEVLWLLKSIQELQFDIEDYEIGITEDIDRTKAEIMQALKRL